jgi:streptogramin lyase
MPRARTLLLPAAALAAALAAQAASLHGDAMAPGQAHVAVLGEARAVSYYTVDGDGAFRVVATVAGMDATPVRATMTLQPGQAATISVPGPAGAAPHEVTFRRTGHYLSVEAPRQQEAALR